MKLRDVITGYVALRRALGGKCYAEKVLRFFCRTLGDSIDIRAARPRAVGAFLAGRGNRTGNWHNKYYVLHSFYQYAVARGYVTSAPLPKTIPKRPPRLVPYIYSHEELRCLLDAASSCQRLCHVIEPQTMRMLVLLLYGAGLRVGEAIALNVEDVDLADNLVTVRRSKFFKSRLVPTGAHLTAALATYWRWRRTAHQSPGGSVPFLVSRNGMRLIYITVCKAFSRLRQHTGIHRTDGGRYQPRLHDLRHSFAVHRLITWYRQGANVQHLLPYLSVYLGHISIAATQVYLTMTPELLEEASVRFAHYAHGEVSHD